METDMTTTEATAVQGLADQWNPQPNDARRIRTMEHQIAPAGTQWQGAIQYNATPASFQPVSSLCSTTVHVFECRHERICRCGQVQRVVPQGL